MLVSLTQKNSQYFKQQPSFRQTAHLSQHPQMQFRGVKYIKFHRPTNTSKQLPKYLIDKFEDNQQKMYWLEWKQQQKSSLNTYKSIHNLRIQPQKNKLTCLYIAELGQLSHIKFVFNYDPEIIAIAHKHLFIVGAQQLFICELWPESLPTTSKMSIETHEEIYQPKIIHQLQSAAILSMDFMYSVSEPALCMIVYFSEKKGYFSRTYSRHEQNNSMNFINKMIDFSYRFKKDEPAPFAYSTLIPNIIGLAFHNSKEFSLMNLTEMKFIENTRRSLEEWSLNSNKPVIIKTRANQRQANYNCCLTISIGQSSNIELFLYNIKYSSSISIGIPPQNASESTFELQYFTSADIICLQQSKLIHFAIIYLDQVTDLTNYVLGRQGVIYLGQKGKFNQMPSVGFISYTDPYTSYKILTDEYKIWRQYKIDIINKNADDFNRLLVLGRYEYQFVLRTFGVKCFDELSYQQIGLTLEQIQQKLIFQWRNQYKFIQFVIFHGEVLIIRKNSIGSLVSITPQQFHEQNDEFAQNQVSYNQLESNGFENNIQIEGDYIDFQQQYKHNDYYRKDKSYEDKVKVRSIQNGYENGWFQQIFFQIRNNHVSKHEDMERYIQLYKATMKQIYSITRLRQLKSIPNHNENQQDQYPIQSQILSYRLKDKLRNFLTTLRLTYPSYLNTLNYHHKQLPKSVYQKYQSQYYKHIYTVNIIEFYVNISTSLSLHQQYDLLRHDFVDEFVDKYLIRYANGHVYAKDLNIHLINLLHLMFKGLIEAVNTTQDQSQIVEATYLDENMAIGQQVDKINIKNNSFMLMLLKFKRKQAQSILNNFHDSPNNNHQHCLISNIIISLYYPLLIFPLNPNITPLLPLSKTLIYTILQLETISLLKKSELIHSLLSSNEVLDMLILIHTENNLYNQCINQCEVGKVGRVKSLELEQVSIDLSQASCCLVEEKIISLCERYLVSESNDSQQDSLAHILYKNIEFSSILSTSDRILKRLNKFLVDQQYNILKKDINMIDNVFRKYYSKIYTSQQQQQQLKQTASHIHPSMCSQFTLSWQQLAQISKLYKKHDRLLRKSNNIQEKLNLEYAMIRIHVFRFKQGLKYLKNSTEMNTCVQILIECLHGICDASERFKNVYEKCFYDQNDNILKLNEKEFIQILNFTIRLQNCVEKVQIQKYYPEVSGRKYSKRIDEQLQQSQQLWKICGYPITEQWLNLLSLTLQLPINSQYPEHFTNYSDLNSILMKILIVIFTYNYEKSLHDLLKLFTNEKIQTIIINNNELMSLYNFTDSTIKQMLNMSKIITKRNNWLG